LPATAESQDLAIPAPTLANPLADLQIDEDTSDVFQQLFHSAADRGALYRNAVKNSGSSGQLDPIAAAIGSS